MAIVDWEGFDRETSNLDIFTFTNFGISGDGQGTFGYGRFAGTTNGAIVRDSWFAPILDGFINCHCWLSGGTNNIGVNINAKLGGANQFTVRLVGGTVRMFRGSTQVASAFVAIPVNVWFFLQIRFRIEPSGTGYCEARLNGKTILTFSGNTADTGAANWNGWSINYTDSPDFRVDNILVYDTSTPAPSTWTPDTRIWETLPNAAGGTTEWTPVGAAANWQCVDEQPANGDTDYVRADTAPLTDTYSCPSEATVGSIIYAVGVHSTLRKDDAGVNEVDGVIRVGSINYARGAPAPLASGAYGRQRWLWHQNPATAAAWTVSEANSAQPGVRRTT